MTFDISLFSLQDKYVLITGATGYLGREMTWAAAEAGATVLVNSRSVERATDLVHILQLKGYRAELAVFDVNNIQSIDNYFSKYAPESLDVLVNNAYFGGAGSIEVCSGDDYASGYKVTVEAAHLVFTAALSRLRLAAKKKSYASVINIASMYGLVSPDQKVYSSKATVNPPFYGAAKAALIQWTRYAACEFGGEGIRVNAISPGPFPSDDVQRLQPDFVNSLNKRVPMGRIGNSAELRGPFVFLASRASSYVNGANIVVDGGWTCW